MRVAFVRYDSEVKLGNANKKLAQLGIQCVVANKVGQGTEEKYRSVESVGEWIAGN